MKNLKKVGAKVDVKRRNGAFVTGKVVEIVESKRGLWYHVNTNLARNAAPVIVKARAAQLFAPTV